jgi:hypothetical protein
MAYTPPGVYTNVVIDSSIVSLPGGTRFLALIGVGRKYKSITGESVIMSASYTSVLSETDVRSVDQVWDYRGVGASVRTYPSTGTSTYGDGWSQSGGTITWYPASNPYPLSTTPATGVTYFANVNYSGSSIYGGDKIAEMTSGSFVFVSGNTADVIVPINLIESGASSFKVIGVWDAPWTGTSPTPAAQFSGTGTTPSNQGWWQSGTSLVFTKGSALDFGTAYAEGAGLLPSGEAFWIQYNYSGTTGVSILQPSTRTSVIVNVTGTIHTTSIISVTGNGVTYLPSGTYTSPDSSGYSTVAAGYYLSGNNYITWAPVNPSTYTYPSLTIPPVSGAYYVNYSFNKTSADYGYQNFSNYSDVANEYGPEVEWVLDTNGNYVASKINSLTLAARLAFANGAPFVTCVQMSGNANTALDLTVTGGPLDSLATDDLISVIVPLTCGYSTSGTEVTLDNKSAMLQAVLSHCNTMSLDINKKERISIGSLGQAEIGDVNTPYTYIYEASQSLKSKRISLVAPGLVVVQVQDTSGATQNLTVDGSFLSVGVGALSCKTGSDVATPLTNQRLSGYFDLSAVTPNHSGKYYLDAEKNNLAAYGNLIIDKAGSRIYVRHQLTTDQSNPANGELSVVTTTDYVSQAVRFTLDGYIGQKLVPSVVIPLVKSSIVSTMSSLSAAGIISQQGDITVQLNPNNPTELLSTVSYVPVFPLNRIKVTFTIKTQI